MGMNEMNACTRQDLADLEVARIQETLDKAVLALEEGREPEVHVQGGKLETFQEAAERDHGAGATEPAEAAEGAEAQVDAPPPADVNEQEPTENSWEESFGGHTGDM